MINQYDIVQYKGQKILILHKEQISSDDFLLRGALLTKARGFNNDEDWKINPDFVKDTKKISGYSVELWNDPVFLIESKKLKKITSLTQQGQISLEQKRENITELPEYQSISQKEKLFELKERIKTVKLSLPYKNIVYSLSMEEEGEIYDRMYLNLLKKESRKLKSQRFIPSLS